MHQQNHAARNKGFVLATSVIILLLITLVTLFAARSIMKEQQVTANQHRSDQALSAANAALDYALAYFDMGGIDRYDNATGGKGSDGYVDELFGDPLGTAGTLVIKDGDDDLVVSAEAFYCDASDPEFKTDPVNCDRPELTDKSMGIVAVGWSDDKSAQHIITVRAAEIGVLGGDPGKGPDFPLTARDATNSTGNVSVINRFTRKTIWSGAATGVSGSGETFVANDKNLDPWDGSTDRTEDTDYAKRVDPDTGTDYTLISTRQNSYVNMDIIEGDPNLKNIPFDVEGETVNPFFENFFNGNKETVAALAKSNNDQRYASEGDLWSTMNDAEVKGIVWVDTVDGTGTWKPTIGNNEILGTPEDPVIMIIDGTLETTGAPGDLNLVGLLYVTGDWNTAGNITVQGMIVVEGVIVAGNGTPTVIYDPTLFGGGVGNTITGATGMIPGSWKDWRN